MPFTLSHAVLTPVISRLSRGHLPLAALAIGCMLPDMYRMFTTDSGKISHLWSGQLYPNLMIGLAFCSLWYVLYRPMLYQLLDLAHPLPIKNVKQWLRFTVLVILALILGNATHIVWDGLTHVDFRTLVLHDFLSQPIHAFGMHYPLHFILQITSSAVALPFLVYWIYIYCQKHRTEAVATMRIKSSIWLSIIVALLTASAWTWGYFASFEWSTVVGEPYYFLGRGFNEFSQAFLLSETLALTCIALWQQFSSAK
ncbi:DUF4184 family protein [uncultured Acinetobacter sp.]|uniref:DUF4184 family protein n=1 Tax=uncultured Acinetobacter sp. TaxID=165433 RepID=UPI002627BC2F|nr:DUF4184 family protein [uncultured Acinetobacter sp.]